MQSLSISDKYIAVDVTLDQNSTHRIEAQFKLTTNKNNQADKLDVLPS